MFTNFKLSKDLAKLDVLESKLNIYESLSREMLDRLENAVDKISESNQRIANILTKHDEKIEQNTKTDELIIKMIDEVKYTNSKEHKDVMDRLKNLEFKIEGFGKFRWVVVGGVMLMTFIFSQPHVIVDILTPSQSRPSIERR